MGTRVNLTVTFSLVAVSVVQSMVRTWNPLDPVGSFFADLAKNLREWYATLLQSIIDVVTQVSVPSPESLVNEFFSLALGGTYGLARVLVALVAVLVAVVILLSPTARHGVKIQRAFTSMLMVIVLGWVFYPLYSLLYNLSTAAIEGALALVKTDGETAFDATLRLYAVVNATDAINTIISTGISGILGVFIIGVAFGLFVMTITLMIFYPLAIATRPLGKFGSSTFNLFNAGILTTLLSPSIMAVTFLLPLYAQKYMNAVAIVASPFFAIIGSVSALVVPFIIFFLAYKKSSEVFGQIDDATGRFDIGEMPPVSVQDVQNNAQQTNNNMTATLVADAVTDSFLYGNGKGDMFDDIVRKGADIAATATAAAGHPWASAGIKMTAGAYSNARLRKQGEEGDLEDGPPTSPQNDDEDIIDAEIVED